MTVYLPEWNSHCTRANCTVLVPYSDELAIHSCTLICLQKQVASLSSAVVLLLVVIAYGNSKMATNHQRFTSSYGGTVAYPAQNFWRDKIFELGKQQYFVWDTTSQSAKWLDMLKIGAMAPWMWSPNSNFRLQLQVSRCFGSSSGSNINKFLFPRSRLIWSIEN